MLLLRAKQGVIAALTCATMCLGTFSASGDVADFNNWFLVEDPAHPGFSAAATSSNATLSAGDAMIPAGTDIGFSSINANTVAEATEGFYFDTASDFTVAIDVKLTTTNLTGFIGTGFGVGPDRKGEDSAGYGFALAEGLLDVSLIRAPAATRDNNPVAVQPSSIVRSPATTTNGVSEAEFSLFVSYDSTSGDVIVAPGLVGLDFVPASPIFGSADISLGDQVQLSFFLRSDELTLPTFAANPIEFDPYGGESAEAVYSNFRVLEGTPILIPEPSAFSLLILTGLTACARPKRRTSHV
ncbi:MAG: hypothetical protein AAGA25_07430 [Planctomycetota bacterium]